MYYLLKLLSGCNWRPESLEKVMHKTLVPKEQVKSVRTYVKQLFISRKYPSSKLQDAVAISLTGHKWSSMMAQNKNVDWIEIDFEPPEIHSDSVLKLSELLNITKYEAIQYKNIVTNNILDMPVPLNIVNQTNPKLMSRFVIEFFPGGKVYLREHDGEDEPLLRLDAGIGTFDIVFTEVVQMLISSTNFKSRLFRLSRELEKSKVVSVNLSEMILNTNSFIKGYIEHFSNLLNANKLRSFQNINQYHDWLKTEFINGLVGGWEKEIDQRVKYQEPNGLFIDLLSGLSVLPEISLNSGDKNGAGIDISDFLNNENWERFLKLELSEKKLFWKSKVEAFYGKPKYKGQDIPEKVRNCLFDKGNLYINPDVINALILKQFQSLCKDLDFRNEPEQVLQRLHDHYERVLSKMVEPIFRKRFKEIITQDSLMKSYNVYGLTF